MVMLSAVFAILHPTQTEEKQKHKPLKCTLLQDTDNIPQ